MKSSKSFFTVITALFMFAVLGLPAAANNVAEEELPQTFVVSDAVLPQAKMPVLRIGGKENADVYLQSLDIQVEVTGNIATTLYTMVFKNRTARVLEGELTFPLPDGRTVTHYALDINGKMREAVPVEKAKATQVFEEIQRREVDPGILERVEGNNFRTRIYPIPAGGARTISIGYEEELPLEKNLLYYRLPMAYSGPLEKFSVKATVWKSSLKPLVPKSSDEIRFDVAGENYVATFARENYKPSRALIFALPAAADIPQVMMQSAQGSHYFLASVAPKAGTRKKQWSDDLAIIWDVSLSGSQRDLKREMEALSVIFTQKKNANVHIYFLNNRLNKIINKNSSKGEYKVAGGNWNEVMNVLLKAVFDGGTDFSQINLKNITGNEILFFSDGFSTLSDADFLRNSGDKRPIHTVVSSSKADYSAMRLIAGKTKGKFVDINALSGEKLKSELLNETLQFMGAEHGEAVREVYPSIAAPVHGNFSVAGISESNETEITLLFGFGDKVERRIKVKLDAKKATSQGNVYKIWAQKKITELDLNYEKNRTELTELGRQFGIVTRNTSLIVLELLYDYVRYGIMPPATEPELQAAYQRSMKGREERRRDTERNMLNDAVAAAEVLKKWWDTDFTPPKPKYPTPDNRRSGASQSSATQSAATQPAASQPSGGSLNGRTVQPRRPDTPIFANEAREASEHPLGTIGTNDLATIIETGRNHFKVSTATGLEGWVAKSAVTVTRASAARDRAFNFESAEVIGYLDNPTPVYIIDMDDPNADPVTLSGPSRHDRARAAPAAASAPSAAKGKKEEPAPQPTITITLKPVKQDNAYLNKLTGKTADDYQTYLKLRNDYANSPTFYFDMADWFFRHNDRERALRILTSIAEIELENASLYRLLGYRFKEYGEYALAKFVCMKVVEWRPMDPQSYRDYALALAGNGEAQAALDSLYGVLTRFFPADNIRRSRGIEEVIVTEINHLIAKNPGLNTSNIDERLLINTAVDVRVVINWNMNNVDIDLHVRDPHNEECYYGRKQTAIGGRISADNTGGYGPEQFLLKKAVRGKYRILVNYYGAREFSPDGPSTVMAEIFTKYADKTEQRRVVCLQMSNVRKKGSSKVEVAEFEF